MKYLTFITLAIGFASSFSLLATHLWLGTGAMTQEQIDYYGLPVEENDLVNVVTLNEYNEFVSEALLYLFFLGVTGLAVIKNVGVVVYGLD